MKCISFEKESIDSNWSFTYEDGSTEKKESFPIKCSLVGNIRFQENPYEEPHYVEDSYTGMHWDFRNQKLCPIKINGKWGFIDDEFNIVLTPRFSGVGRCYGPYYDAVQVCDWKDGYVSVWIDNEEHLLGIDFLFHDELKKNNYEKKKEIDAIRKSIIEQSTNYAYKLKYMENPTFDKVRDLAIKFMRELPKQLQDELYEALNRGIDILDTEPQMVTYLYAFGPMHQAKLNYAFKHLPEEFLAQPEINIIDYGCGQALGTMCYADYLRKNGYAQKVKTITLIEPSEICLKRAALQASVFFPEAEIKTINKKFDDLINEDIVCNEEAPTLHILSNVLDMLNFDIDKFANLVNSCLKGYNQFVCVGPYFNYSDRDERMNVFHSQMDGEEDYYETFDKYEFDPKKTWTAQVCCFSKGSDNCINRIVEKRFDENLVELSNDKEIPSTAATEKDLKEAVKDEHGVLYSRNGELLLECKNQLIETYTIKPGTKVICDCAFEDCFALKQITIPNSVTIIGYSAFSGCESLRQMIIPESVTFICNGAFSGCSSLQKILIPNSITLISYKAFEWCQSLQQVVIPNSVISIKDKAFDYCSLLKQIEIPDSVSQIGNAFYWSLERIIIPKGTTAKFIKLLDDDLWEKIYEASNNETESLIHPQEEIGKHITEVSEDAIKKGVKDPIIYAWTPVLYSKSWKRLLKCKNNYLETYSIKRGTKIICDKAFENMWRLQNINIPDTVTAIGKESFYGCQSIQTISIPNSITTIGENAFGDCNSLQQILISKGSMEKFKKMLEEKLWDKLVEQ